MRIPSINILDNEFIPYTLDDLGVIIPHCSRMTKRWEWFWPQYAALTPKIVLDNTVVVYHNRHGDPLCVPDNVKAVEDACRLIVLDEAGENVAKPTLLGLDALRTRLVARIHNDIDLKGSTLWAEDAICEFNKEPHLKILAEIVGPASPYSGLQNLSGLWLRRYLRHGDYHEMSFILGAMIIANRAVWMAYYPMVAELTPFECEDIYFSLFTRADGIPVVHWGRYFQHRGRRHQDVIT